MKINEFTQLDEFFTRASRITRSFKSYVKQNNLQPTHQAFVDYMNSKNMDTDGVIDLLNKAGLEIGSSTSSSTSSTGITGAEIGKNFIDGKKVNPLNKDATTPQKPGAGVNQAVGKQTTKQPQPKTAQPTIKVGQKKQGSDGQEYIWKGAQWVGTKTGRMATKAMGAELKKEDSDYNVNLLEKELNDKDIEKLATQAAKDNPGGAAAMASGLRKGYKVGRNPLKTVGGAIADKFKGAADAYDDAEKKEKGGSTQDTRAGVNTLRTELGLENPAMAVKALEKLQAGKPLSNKNELNAVKPIINAVQAALQSTQGRARLKQLIKTLS